MNTTALIRKRPSVGYILAVCTGIAGIALTVGILGSRLDEFVAAASRARLPHFPDLALFAGLPSMVQVHMLAALGAVGLGAVMMMSRKGQRFHRIAGWIWAGLMTAVALSSLFIFDLNAGRWSYLHLFAGWVLIFVPLAVLAARRHVVAPHRALMMLLFYGSLLVSGALAFLPGRVMWRLFFG